MKNKSNAFAEKAASSFDLRHGNTRDQSPKGDFQGFTPVVIPPDDPAAAAAAHDKLRTDLQTQQAKDAYWVKTHPGIVTPGLPATGWNASQWPTTSPNPLGDVARLSGDAFQEVFGIKSAKGATPGNALASKAVSPDVVYASALDDPDVSPEAKERLRQATLAGKSSEPFVDGVKVYPQPDVPGNGTGVDPTEKGYFSTQASLERIAAQMKAEGRTRPNAAEIAEMALLIPGHLIENTVHAAISGATLPGDVFSGKQRVMDPTTGNADLDAIGRSLDLTGLMSSGSFAGAPKGALGSGPVRPKVATFTTKEQHYLDLAQMTYEQRVKKGAQAEFEGLIDSPEAKAAHAKINAEAAANNPNVQVERKKADALYENGTINDAEYEALLAKVERGGKVDAARVAESNTEAQSVLDDQIAKNPNFLEEQAAKLREAVHQSADDNPDFVAPKPVTLHAGGKSGAALLALDDGFYSKAARVVEALPTKSASADQWIATLKNKGVKDEELDGLDLPPGVVTKEELLAKLKPPEIKEVVKGGREVHDDAELDIQTTDRVTDDIAAEYRREHPNATDEEVNGYIESDSTTDRIWEETQNRLDRLAEENDGSVTGGGTKYQQYQLPGGENYREILVTMPNLKELSLEERAEYNALQKKIQSVNSTGDRALIADEELNRFRELAKKMGLAATDDQKYRSSHWDEPNVLGHIRVNDRKLMDSLTPEQEAYKAERAKLLPEYEKLNAELQSAVKVAQKESQAWYATQEAWIKARATSGEITPGQAAREISALVAPNDTPAGQAVAEALAKRDALKLPPEPFPNEVRTLHAEELQSDWHQQGKKQGYKPNADPAAVKAARDKLTDASDQLRNHLTEAGRTPEEVNVALNNVQNRRIPSWLLGSPKNEHFATDYIDALDAVKELEGTGKVPDAPFKKSWPDLLLKRLVKRAVDEGYDAISWTDGATQAARYDLSKQLDAVNVVRRSNGNYDLQGTSASRNHELGSDISADKLPDYVGKDLADKIVNNPEKGATYKGVDLKVGGEGMKAFYDQELPRRAKKLFGAAVGKKPLNPSKVSVDDLIENMTDGDFSDASAFLRSKGVNSKDLGGDYNTANKALELGWSPKSAEGGDASVHFLRLTPEIVAKVKAGQPVFAAGVPLPTTSDDGKYKLVPVKHNPFE